LREALGQDRPREPGHDREDEAELDRDSTPGERRAAAERRDALGRDAPRDRGHDRHGDADPDRDSTPSERSAVEELRRILEEQRDHDRDRSDAFERLVVPAVSSLRVGGRSHNAGGEPWWRGVGSRDHAH